MIRDLFYSVSSLLFLAPQLRLAAGLDWTLSAYLLVWLFLEMRKKFIKLSIVSFTFIHIQAG